MVTVTKITALKDVMTWHTHSGSLPGHMTRAKKSSKVSVVFAGFSFKLRTAALLNPGHMYSPNTSSKHLNLKPGSRSNNMLRLSPVSLAELNVLQNTLWKHYWSGCVIWRHNIMLPLCFHELLVCFGMLCRLFILREKGEKNCSFIKNVLFFWWNKVIRQENT